MTPSPPVHDQPGASSPAGLRLHHKRCILSLLSPLMGTRATATALVQATAGAVVLPANSYAQPHVQSAVTGSAQSQVDFARLIKAGTLPLNQYPVLPGTRPVDLTIDPVADPDGTTIPVYAQLGGTSYHGAEVGGLVVGTPIEWNPPIAGIEPVSVLATAFAGGVAETRRGSLRRLVLFDDLGLGNLALKGASPVELAAWKAKISDFPTGVLILMGSRKREDTGWGHPVHNLRWRLLILTSSVGPQDERAQDGDASLDWAVGLLQDQGDIDGQAFSLPRIEVGDTNFLLADASMNVHAIDFTSCATFDRLEARSFEAWTSSTGTLVTDASAEYPDEEDALVTASTNVNQ